jgi:hypothetical protein
MADLIAEPLRALLDDVALGRYPAPDGSVTVAPKSTDGRVGVFGFTAHTVIVADVDRRTGAAPARPITRCWPRYWPNGGHTPAHQPFIAALTRL